MNCGKCDQLIRGNRWEDAISTRTTTSMRDGGPFVHFECVDDPMNLPPDQFQKYAAWRMNRDRQERQAFEAYVKRELEIIHRALHALPTELTEAYTTEIYDSTADVEATGLGL